MPLTSKGKKIQSAMRAEYGKKKGDSVFYASINKGKVKGAEGGKVSNVQMYEAERQRARSFSQGAAVGGSGQGYGGKAMGFGGKVMAAHPMAHAKSNSSGRW